MHPRWLRISALVVAGLLLLAALGLQRFDAIALDNLDNTDFQRVDEWTPADAGLPFSWFNVTTDGVHLAGWSIPGTSDITVLLVHGHGGTKGDVAERWAPMLHAAGHHVMVFDLRNHGQSDDAGPITFGMVEADDVLTYAALAATEASIQAGTQARTVLMGGSMGAAAVLRAATVQHPVIAGAIADSTYEAFRAQAYRDGEEQGYPRPIVDIVVARMDALAPAPPSHVEPERWLAQIQVPVMLAHCTDDIRIPFEAFGHLLAAAERAGNLAAEWTGACPTGLSPNHHVDGWAQPGYNATVLDFIARL